MKLSTRDLIANLRLSRRRFLRDAGILGGGLVLGTLLPARAGSAVGSRAEAEPIALGSWIRVAADGRVTVWVEKAEMGQGIHSSLAAIVAEELDVPWEQVAVESRPLDGALRSIGTGASMSIREMWQPLRAAGAAARSMLVRAAADSWGTAAAGCEARAGFVLHPASGRSLGYGALVESAAALPVPEHVELKDPREFRLIGRSLARLDLPAKVSGAATFGIDVKVDGMLHAAPAMSASPGAHLEHSEESTALAMPGVRAVVPVPSGVVVVADHYWQAKQASVALEPVFAGGETPIDSDAYSLRLREALETPGVPAGEIGSVDAALATAPRVFEARYEVPFLAHATMEPMNCTAWARDGACELWAPTQSPTAVREAVGEALRIDPERVTVNVTLLGGGFGRRAETDYAVQAALASQAVSRPVKVIWSREDDIRHDYYRPACAAHLRAAIGEDGRPSGFALHVAGPWSERTLPGWLRSAIGSVEKKLGSALAPEGSLPDFLWWRLPHLARSGVDWIASGNSPPLNYRVPSQRLEYSLVDNALPVGWWRSVPASQNAFFVESFIDELAHAASVDPCEYRRGLLGERDRAVLERAAEMAGWGRKLAEGRALGVAQFSMVGTTVCEIAEVSVGASGAPEVHRVFCAIDCGLAVNPDTIRAQVEGSILFGLTAARYGRITVEGGRVVQRNFHDYPLLSFAETPEIDVQIIESRVEPSGVGEPATPPIAAAVANAMFAATGRRSRSLPLG